MNQNNEQPCGMLVNQGRYLQLAHSALVSSLNHMRTATPLDPGKFTPETFVRCEAFIVDMEKLVAYFEHFILPDVGES